MGTRKVLRVFLILIVEEPTYVKIDQTARYKHVQFILSIMSQQICFKNTIFYSNFPFLSF